MAGAESVHFLKADVRTYHPSEPLDAVVGRLILFHLPDAVEILRHYVDALKPGGLMLAVDFDIGSARTEPALPLFTTVAGRVMKAFRNAGANPTIGPRLAMLLRDAGFEQVTSFGVQDYLGPDDRRGPALLAGVVRSLQGQIVAAGIATEAELDLGTLQQRLAHELATADAVMLPPAVAGAWGRRG